MSASIPRFLLPRGHILSSPQLPKLVNPPFRRLPNHRNASAASTSKPRVLEKPTRFNPPSHGKRLKQEVPRNYGPQLTAEQKIEQETKKYPHTMPAKGTFMYWFLTTTSIHTFISLVRPQSSNNVHCWEIQSSSQDVKLNCPHRASSSASPPLWFMKDGSVALNSAQDFPHMKISTLIL